MKYDTNYVFVYSKKDKFKVLTLNDSTEVHEKLKAKNWKHTGTLNGSIFLTYLLHLPNDKRRIKAINDLKNGEE